MNRLIAGAWLTAVSLLMACEDGGPPDAGVDCETWLVEALDGGLTVGLASAHSATVLDPELAALRERYALRGVALAISIDGGVVYARAQGYANEQERIPLNADARMRVGSVSKHLTALAVRRLVEEGSLSTDERVIDILSDLHPFGDAGVTRGFEEITVQHLLNHTAGWYHQFYDPVFASRFRNDPDRTGLLRLMLDAPLRYPPGTTHCYANVSYIFLAEIIERRAGVAYDAYVASEITSPSGAMRTLLPDARTTRIDDEVLYSGTDQDSYWNLTVLPRSIDGAGGWVSTPVDLLRIVRRADGMESFADVITFETLEAMRRSANVPYVCDENTGNQVASQPAYGEGVAVLAPGQWGHAGRLPGMLVIASHAEPDVAVVAFLVGEPRGVVNAANATYALVGRIRDHRVANTLAFVDGDLADLFGEFTAWMPIAEFEAIRSARDAEGKFARRVEGRSGAHGAEFRAMFSDALGRATKTRTDLSCAQLREEHHAAGDMMMTGLHRYGPLDASRFAASWIRP